MTISINVENKICKVAVDGEMTIFVAEELHHALQEPLSKGLNIDFDLSNVSEIDAAGLQLMVLAKQACVKSGSQLNFLNHSTAVQDVLELTDLGGYFGDPIILSSD